ncbi:hypothetical protein H2200_011987 [Cladophialophora chaetospira]|uniref:Rhodopsin domain-containing protein n=1 Tax=Cladophialophora chaetospira TaxID=386627 RepID=A0AA39CD17_9EURO|nr:hypothetical protein H2200_011987 [Cladophialophora chaetospira]
MAAAFPRRDAIDDGVPNPRGDKVVHVNIALVVVATSLVVARFWTRIAINNMLGRDDWCVLMALAIAITMTGLFYGEAENGFGLHKADVSKEHFLQAWKYFLACQVLYKAAVLFAKLSMLFLYLRIFASHNFRIAAYAVMFICVGTAIGTILPTIFACQPIRKAWIPTEPGKCIWLPGIWYASSSINIATDLMIIVLPFAQMRLLKVPKFQKLSLVALFSLGFFIIATCVVRIATLAPATTAKDTTYYQAQNNLWLGIEVNTSIIVACIPPLKATVTRFFPQLWRGSSYRPTINYRSSSGAQKLPDSYRGSSKGTTSPYPIPPLSPTSGMHRTVVIGGLNSHSYPISESNSDEVVMLDDMGKTATNYSKRRDNSIVKETEVEVTYTEVP